MKIALLLALQAAIPAPGGVRPAADSALWGRVDSLTRAIQHSERMFELR